MGARGPKPWEPTAAERRTVEHYVAIGYTNEQVASLMGISETCLKKHCALELKNGALKVNAQVGGKLFQKAMSGDTASLIFWCKTRMGWKETSGIDLNAKDGIKVTFERVDNG